MKLIVAVLLCCASAAAQSLTLSASGSTVAPGGQINLTVGFVDASPSANVAGVQWTLALPSGAVVSPGIGLIVTKPLSCNQSACLMIGSGTPLNSTALATGALATIPVTIAAGTPAGTFTVSLVGTMGASVAGASVTLNSPSVTLTVISSFDLNGDGVVNQADVAIAQQQALGQSLCTNADLNGDGKCTVADVQLVILAATPTVK